MSQARLFDTSDRLGLFFHKGEHALIQYLLLCLRRMMVFLMASPNDYDRASLNCSDSSPQALSKCLRQFRLLLKFNLLGFNFLLWPDQGAVGIIMRHVAKRLRTP